MNLTEFLTHFVRLTYIVLGLFAVISYLRQRERARLDIALMLGTLGIVVLVQEYTAATGQTIPWLSKISSILTMAHPYLLLRLVEHFRPVPLWVRRIAQVGLAVSAGAILVLPTPLPTPIVLLLVAYFVFVEAYSAVAFLRGAFTTGGVSRRRLWLAAAGSGLLASVIFVAGILVLNPETRDDAALAIQGLTALSAISYYLGFATPRWLRRTWQLNELHRFLTQSALKSASARATDTLPFLCTMASRAVGGRAAAAALWDETAQTLTIATADHPTLAGMLSATEGTTGRAWKSGRPALARRPVDFSPPGLALAQSLSAEAMIAVPIATLDHRWGLLAVFLQRGPLFPADDLDLLALFAEQSALALDQTALLAEQKALLAEQHKLVAELQERSVQLEAANKELEAFSYSVSHDLRAPLRHIEGFTDLLLRGNLPEDRQHGQLTRIAEASARMGKLIDDLLAFSRLNRTQLRRVPTPLSRLVADVQNELQADLDGRSINWQISDLPEVPCDPDLLKLVFVNLISNAVKYTRPRAQAQIDIGCREAEDGQIIIYIRDNGVGFDMQYADKLFGVFQRLHHADEFEGIGIGLANVRRIIHRHGGSTWAEAKPDAGATFYFSLPLAPDLADVDVEAANGQPHDLPSQAGA